jgi:hypothetical protein
MAVAPSGAAAISLSAVLDLLAGSPSATYWVRSSVRQQHARRCTVLTARAFDAAGGPAAVRPMEFLLLSDNDGRPFRLLPQLNGDDVLTIALPDRDFQLMRRLPVAGFGKVCLYAVTGAVPRPCRPPSSREAGPRRASVRARRRNRRGDVQRTANCSRATYVRKWRTAVAADLAMARGLDNTGNWSV